MKLAENSDLIKVLSTGGVAVIRTDTLYGLVASANDPVAVEKVYAIKHRDPLKSCIILVDSPNAAYSHSTDLAHDIALHSEVPTSFLLEADDAPEWLLRQNTELAYRVPAHTELRALLTQTGPLIAPSANPEGLPPAQTIEQAKKYFGSAVDIYVDGGTVPADISPSKLVRIYADGREEWLR